MTRSPGSSPSGFVWSKKSRSAMSSEWPWAALPSLLLRVSGPQPLLARSALTSRVTSALYELPAGACGACGALGAVLVRVGFGVAFGFGALVFEGVALGDGFRLRLGEAEGDFVGAEAVVDGACGEGGCEAVSVCASVCSSSEGRVAE